MQQPSPSELALAVERHHRRQALLWTRLLGGEVHGAADLTIYVCGRPVPFANGVLEARLEPAAAAGRVRHALGIFASRGVPATWWVGPSTRPPDLGALLEESGFRHREDVPWMAVELDLASEPPPSPELVVQRVSAGDLQRAWTEVMAEGFGLSAPVASYLGEAAEAAGYDAMGPWLRYVGFVGDRPVATSGLVPTDEVAGVYNVTTVPALRRRGFGAAMTGRALLDARARGYRVAVLGTSSMGRGIYERMGFSQVCLMRAYVWKTEERAREQG